MSGRVAQETSVALYQAIKDANEDRVFEHWHASSIAMCPKAHYMKRLAVPELTKPTGAKVLRWSAGHYLEAGIRPHIEKVYGGLASNERMTSEDLQLTGEFDNLVIANNRLVEIKSVSDFAFIERDGQTVLKKADGTWPNGKTRWKASDEPYLGHQLQNHAYVLLLAEIDKEVKHIDYVYISLSGRIVVYSTEVQEKYLENVKKRLAVLNKSWQPVEEAMIKWFQNNLKEIELEKWIKYVKSKGAKNLGSLSSPSTAEVVNTNSLSAPITTPRRTDSKKEKGITKKMEEYGYRLQDTSTFTRSEEQSLSTELSWKKNLVENLRSMSPSTTSTELETIIVPRIFSSGLGAYAMANELRTSSALTATGITNFELVLNTAWESRIPPDCICKPEHPLYDSVMRFCPYKTEEGCCNLGEKLHADN